MSSAFKPRPRQDIISHVDQVIPGWFARPQSPTAFHQTMNACIAHSIKEDITLRNGCVGSMPLLLVKKWADLARSSFGVTPHCDSSSADPIGIVALMPKEATPDKANAPAQVMKA